MNQYEIKQFSFAYEGEEAYALQDICLTIESGKYYVFCGQSGSGKSTLLRHLKSALAPSGQTRGSIFYCGRELGQVPQKLQSSEIGYVFQNPDSQLVTDKVWHEMVFGAESLGMSQERMDASVAEIAAYLGISSWFRKDVSKLSGGQKQLLNLASVLVMHPKVLVLDEPVSQLDPIAAETFLDTVYRINQELGVTILLAEHDAEKVFRQSDYVILMENGKIAVQGSVQQIGEYVQQNRHPMMEALPAAMKMYYAGKDHLWCRQKERQGEMQRCPVSVTQGRRLLEQTMRKPENCGQAKKDRQKVEILSAGRQISRREIPHRKKIMQARELAFRYQKNEPDILKNVSFSLYEGEIMALMGGNGSGKSTLLKVLSRIERPWKGKITYAQKECAEECAMLPQAVSALFTEKTVKQELGKAGERQEYYIRFFGLQHLLDRHPYDLSGGEQQKVALAKILLTHPNILLLDEPTKGLDAWHKKQLGQYLQKLSQDGMTILLVSHDVAFCAEYTHRAGLLFDGRITALMPSKRFFTENYFYTTAANRMAREYFPNVVTDKELAEALSGTQPQGAAWVAGEENECSMDVEQQKAIQMQEVAGEEGFDGNASEEVGSKKNSSGIWFSVGIFTLYPFLIWMGSTLFENRRYLFIGAAMAVYGCLPFFLRFERKKHSIRQLVVLCTVTALAVIGRGVFFMTPSIKPVGALAVIAGVSMGAESGFFVGSMSMLVSNMLFGQGPWTPWQMFAMGLVGFFAGVLFHKKKEPKKCSMMLYGFCATLILYGGIINFASLLMASYDINPQTIAAIYASGIPMDLLHAAGNAVFLFLLAKPMLEKLNRVSKA